MVTQRADSLARPSRSLCCFRRQELSRGLLAHEKLAQVLLDFLGNRRESFLPHQCGPEQTHTDPTCRFFWAFSILLVWLYRRGATNRLDISMNLKGARLAH